MLSYQHGYHAGNFADVHKHIALCLLLDHLSKETRMVTYIDSHSGRGHYDLRDAQSQKTAEWQDGIGRLLSHKAHSRGLDLYLSTLSAYEPQIYPGSPELIRSFMADHHRAHCFELHPSEFKALSAHFQDAPMINTHHKDATQALFDYLPARKTPGLVLIDPSYEVKQDYETIGNLGRKITKKWPAAILLVWYPVLKEARHLQLKENLRGTLCFEMPPANQNQRMLATGLLVINAPDFFQETFEASIQEVQSVLRLKRNL